MTQNKEHSLWVEKYRPNKLEDYITNNDNFKHYIQSLIDKQNIPHLLLTGPAGTGKTTLAKLLKDNIDCDYLYINASDEKGIDVVRDKIKRFAMSMSFKPLKIIILDEADFFNLATQGALRNIIEEYSEHTRFILTANYKERIIDPLKSRLHHIELVSPDKNQVYLRLKYILNNENIDWDKEVLVDIIKKYHPDVRKIISIVQNSIIDNKLFKINSLGEFKIDKFISLIKPGRKSWLNTRQYLLDNNINDYDFIFRILYDNVEKFAKGNEGLITIIIADYQWKNQQVIDKEINMAACLAKITNNL